MTEQPSGPSQFDAYAGSYDAAVNQSLAFLGDAVRSLSGADVSAGFDDIRMRAILSVPIGGRLSRRLDLALGRLGLGAQYFVRGTA